MAEYRDRRRGLVERKEQIKHGEDESTYCCGRSPHMPFRTLSVSFKTASSTGLAYRKSGSFVSKYVVEVDARFFFGCLFFCKINLK